MSGQARSRWPRSPGVHRLGRAAPTWLVLVDGDGSDPGGAQDLVALLDRLHEQGALNFSLYSQLDFDAGVPAAWAGWIRDGRPASVLFARAWQPGDAEILAYCHDRGISVVGGVLAAERGQRSGQRLDEARDTFLAACDLLYADRPALAPLLRGRFPRVPVWWREDRQGIDEAARQLLDEVTRHRRAKGWRQLVGTGRRAGAVAANLARVVLQRAWGPVQRDGDARTAPLRVLFIANSFLPTLQLCFTRPLQPLADADAIAWEVLADIQLHRPGRVLSGGRARWAARRIKDFRPHLVVFCRYSGAHAKLAIDWARRHGVPTIYHLDDDLLSVPPELGPEKHAFHNHPARLAAVRHLLDQADLVYCSTRPLLERMRQHGFRGRGHAARIHCPGEVLRGAPEGAELIIGYMGIDHAHDFEVALPALVRVMERNPGVRFELFGPIAMPAVLGRFGDRVSRVPFVRSYEAFLRTFATLGWAIGICPLADTAFNRFKANNKWVEYTAAGVATVATAGMLYDECCADGCGLLAGDDLQWEDALQALIDQPAHRRSVVEAAQQRLRREYSPEALRLQTQEVFADVLARSAGQLTGDGADMRRMTAEGGHGD